MAIGACADMKRRIVKAFERLAYWLLLDALFYRLNRKAKRTLCFHNVLPDGMRIDGEAGSFDESASHFREMIREIGKRFRFSTDVLDASTATITFDDGYLNQYEIAARILREEGNIPAILFVAGSNLNNADPMKCLVTDALTHWVTFAEGVADGSAAKRMEHWRIVLRPQYAAAADTRGRNVLEKCDKAYPLAKIMAVLPDEYKRLRLTGVTEDQVRDLRVRGWKVGWHTQSHFPLCQLSAAEQEKELRPHPLFAGEVMAYPYGCPGSIDEETAGISERVGFPLALSAVNNVPSWRGAHLLPRMYVGGDRYSLHFELSGFKHFLKTRCLLPRSC